MERTNNIVEQFKERFPAIDTETAALSDRQVYITLPDDIFLDALDFSKDSLGFDHLCTITGMDTGENYEFIYHMADVTGMTLNLRRISPRGDGVTIPSVLPIFNGATFYERELEALLGIVVEGLPAGRQYPLPDNWPRGEYPMRKGWTMPAQDSAANTPETEKEGQDG